MPDTGFILVTTANEIDAVDRIAWTNPGNVTADDGNNASVALTTGQSSKFIAAVIGDDNLVPSNATIDGIEVQFDRNFSDLQLGLNVYLTKDGVDLASDGRAADGGTGLTVVGGPADLWGTTWVPSEVNTFTFGTEFAYGSGADGTGTIDAAWVKVYYTEAPDAGGVRMSALGGMS